MAQMARAEGVTEGIEGGRSHALTGLMNNLRHSAEGSWCSSDLIYALTTRRDPTEAGSG